MSHETLDFVDLTLEDHDVVDLTEENKDSVIVVEDSPDFQGEEQEPPAKRRRISEIPSWQFLNGSSVRNSPFVFTPPWPDPPSQGSLPWTSEMQQNLDSAENPEPISPPHQWQDSDEEWSGTEEDFHRLYEKAQREGNHQLLMDLSLYFFKSYRGWDYPGMGWWKSANGRQDKN